MKLLLVLLPCIYGALVSPEQVDTHLNSLMHSMPARVEMVELQSMMFSGATIDVRDEIATLLKKMHKDLKTEEAQQKMQDINTQNDCERRLDWYQGNITADNATEISDLKKAHGHKHEHESIPDRVKKQEAAIEESKKTITQEEQGIVKKQKQRDDDHDAYLKSLSEFNKALDDVDKLRTLVATGLSNRGSGANSDDTRHTQSPTQVGKTNAPTAAPRKDTHTGADAGKFIEENDTFLEMTVGLMSNEQLASLSHSESVSVMQHVYDNLASQTNHVIRSVVGTLDAAMVELQQDSSGSAVDKIKSLLIEVRNELQKNKRDATTIEDDANNSWRDEKIMLRNHINDIKIAWQGTYYQIASLWKQFGVEHVLEGDARRTAGEALQRQDNDNINHDFEDVVCKTDHANYVAASTKRYGQMEQVKKALELLSKMTLTGKAGEMVRETIKDINAGLCRQFTDNSTFFNVDPSPVTMYNKKLSPTPSTFNLAAWNVFPNKDRNGRKYICTTQIRTKFKSVRREHRIFSRVWLYGNPYDPNKRRYAPYTSVWHTGKTNTRILRLPDKRRMNINGLKWNYSFNWKFYVRQYQRNGRSIRSYSKSKGLSRQELAIFVVPGCNCNSVHPDLVVKHNAADTKDQNNTKHTALKTASVPATKK